MSDQVSGEQQSPSVGGSGSGAVATAPKSRTGLYVIVGVAVFAIVAIWIYSVQQDRRDALERAQDSGVATGSASPTDAASVESMSDEDREALYLSMVTSDVEGASEADPDDLVALGRAYCSSLEAGVHPVKTLRVLTEFGLSGFDAGRVMGLSSGVFCPEYSEIAQSQLDSLVEEMSQ